MLEKSFDPVSAEPRLYRAWEESNAFKPSATGEPFTIVIPPPNVTGSLHMGHALNNTLQDVLCRFQRMRGRSVLWQPGTDHAGIATQMVVERQMMERQEPKRTDIGREKFLEKVWKWKAESGGAIIGQLKRLGASCDWSRERFTMDEGLSDAVRKVFVQLYREGLIYRDKRLVNWDPKLLTAISDLEVENEEVAGHFWHFKYPLENGETYQFPVAHDDQGNPTEWETRDYISIATTRPETMLGDGAVAVHPSDARYAPIVGKRCLLPLAERYIPIIADDYPDPDFGSGAVKITGAHDFNDYKVAMRNGIPLYVLMDEHARMERSDFIPEKYRGLDRFEARRQIVADLDERGLLIKVEDKKIMQPFGDRSGVVIEPMLTDQWYVNAEELAKQAIKAVEEGRTRFVPENWTKTYFQWMRNIEPWCISRQLWWGHQIPAWYGKDDDIFVAENEEEAIAMARQQYADAEILVLDSAAVSLGTSHGRSQRGSEQPVTVSLRRDEDVLDTWFSSALWPFSTMGWPDETPALAARYPNSVLVTAFDIIFFWVARMMMMGTHLMNDVPFRDVYIHALVLDEKGQKMSKSKGNVIDPLTLIDKYGADALRFSLAVQAAQGRNIRLSDARIEGYRNFGTKLWNAARFCEMNGCVVDPAFDPAEAHAPLSRWIIHETACAARATTEALDAYRFNDAAGTAYRFAWNIFCDWHVELAKPILQGPDDPQKSELQAVTAWTLDQILKLLHPFMPFITEELWGARGARQNLLIVEPWPDAARIPVSDVHASEINWVIDLISAVRALRAEMNAPAAARLDLLAIAPDEAVRARVSRHGDLVMRLARLERIDLSAASAPAGSVQLIHDGAVFALPLSGIIDMSAEKARLEREVAKAVKEIEIVERKLNNPAFVDKAPPEVVDEQRERRDGYVMQRDKLSSILAALS